MVDVRTIKLHLVAGTGSFVLAALVTALGYWNLGGVLIVLGMVLVILGFA